MTELGANFDSSMLQPNMKEVYEHALRLCGQKVEKPFNHPQTSQILTDLQLFFLNTPSDDLDESTKRRLLEQLNHLF
jgi:hypothetical protein